MVPGPQNLITDVPGIVVGNASDDDTKSGVTVLTSETPFVAAVDIRGGAPGTRETDLLAPGRLVEVVDALVLSGGSAFGLDAGSGVSEALRSEGRGFVAANANVPIVPAAILFDLSNGGDKTWVTNPYSALGRSAYEVAGKDFALGTAGAGTGALTLNLKGGLGSASLCVADGLFVGALVAVNSTGAVTFPDDRRFWAAHFEIDGEFGGLGAVPGPIGPYSLAREKPGANAALANTTLAIVATNAPLNRSQARRMAEVAHDGFARAILPSHTPFDGDLVFAGATCRDWNGVVNPRVEMEIGHAAAICTARAIARGVYSAVPRAGDPLPCWSELAT